MLNTNIQLFAEPAEQTEPLTESVNAVNAVNTVPVNTNQPQGKTYSAEYVHDLREEAKASRQNAKSLETSLRAALGIDSNEELGDISGRITAMHEANTKAIAEATAKANAKLLSAELKNLDGYDTKLLAKVADFSTLEYLDDGTIKGFKEAVENAEKEYPSVKISSAPKYASGTGSDPVNGVYSPEMTAFMRAAGLTK